MTNRDLPVNFEELCNECPHQNCCTNSQEPILFENDISNLKSVGKFTEKYIQTISINNSPTKAIRKKENSSECIFWENSKCTIYDHRPFDCKVYPFDILKIDGKFFWIVYSCNEDSSWGWSEDFLKMFESDKSFKGVLENLEIFAGNTERILPEESKKTPYQILREVKNNFNHE